MMRGVLHRDLYADAYVFGTLRIFDGPLKVFECRTLERPWKDNAVGTSCIPAGIYPVVSEWSAHFQRELNELKHVPGRSEVKIHVANYVKQLRGCIGVGLSVGDINADGVPDLKSSGLALKRLDAALEGVLKWELEIIGDGRDTLRHGMNGY